MGYQGIHSFRGNLHRLPPDTVQLPIGQRVCPYLRLHGGVPDGAQTVTDEVRNPFRRRKPRLPFPAKRRYPQQVGASKPRLISDPSTSRWLRSAANFASSGGNLQAGDGKRFPSSAETPNPAITLSQPSAPPKCWNFRVAGRPWADPAEHRLSAQVQKIAKAGNTLAPGSLRHLPQAFFRLFFHFSDPQDPGRLQHGGLDLASEMRPAMTSSTSSDSGTVNMSRNSSASRCRSPLGAASGPYTC